MDTQVKHNESVDSIAVVEKSIDEVLECIRFCAEAGSLKKYKRLLADLKSYLISEYKLEIQKARFAADLEGVVILEMLLNRKLRALEAG